MGRQHGSLLESHRFTNCHGTKSKSHRERSPVRAAESLDGGRRHCLLGCQIPLCLLAPNHRHSGDIDGNAATAVDPAWTPWLDFFPAGTPPHPEYPSGHSTVSGAAAFILEAAFGDNTPFTVTSDVRQGTRSFSSFSAATAEIADARVFGGIHYRNSCVQGNAVGRAVADYVLSHAMRSPNEH
ncbi:MAG: hypothetical protein DMG41_08470 [Acidobacteria bacterium]|nr:MAG: hypothetical protein DMG42_13500 [Acidobacteriota bacterium]PYT89300.1 MAG: hypothetical protein DMG41_08470 [Acidobacteriota bacterium]